MTEQSKRLTRRDTLRVAGALGATALFAPAIIREANAQSSFNWKRFAGQKIDVLYVKNTRADLLVAKNKEFEALTGIQVSAEAIPEQQQRQKVTIEFTSGKPTFDVVALSLHVQKRIAAEGQVADRSEAVHGRCFADQSGAGFRRYRPGGTQLLDPE